VEVHSTLFKHAKQNARQGADASHFALQQMAVAHNSVAAVFCELVGVLAEEIGSLGLDGLDEQTARAPVQRLR
jgi:hypothetical protein